MTKSKKTTPTNKCSQVDLDAFLATLNAVINEAKPNLPWARIADLEQAKLGISALKKQREKNK